MGRSLECRGARASTPMLPTFNSRHFFNKDFLYLPPQIKSREGHRVGDRTQDPKLQGDCPPTDTQWTPPFVHAVPRTAVPIHGHRVNICQAPRKWLRPQDSGRACHEQRAAPRPATLASRGLFPSSPIHLVISTELPVWDNLGIFFFFPGG